MNKFFLTVFCAVLFVNEANAEAVRILPLGDSITQDWAFSDAISGRPDSLRSGYRNYLWYALKAAKYDVDFVGLQSGGSAIRPRFDTNHDGIAGLKSTQVAGERFYNLRLVGFKPHIILLHIGTNDWSSSTSGVRATLDMIDSFEETYHFHTRVILAKIINSRERHPIFSRFNRNLESLVRQRNARGDDVVLVDMENGAGIHYDSRDFQDRIHPNNSGYRKMANVWFRAIDNILKNKTDNNYAYLVPAVYHMLLN